MTTRLLVVDDEPINREILIGLIELIEPPGLIIDQASDGLEAIRTAKAHRYDLILLDLHMPNLDGLATCRHLRSLPEYARVPIVAVTANVVDDLKRMCQQAGMSSFLTKPLVPDILFETLRQWIPLSTFDPAR